MKKKAKFWHSETRDSILLANAYLKPILDQNKTMLQTNLNTKKDLIDSTLPDVEDDFILTFRKNTMPEAFPLIEIFPFGGMVVESEFENVNVEIGWIIANRITVQADTEQAATQALDVYLTAMVQAITSGTTSAWDLDTKVDRLILRDWEYPAEGEFDGTILKQGALIWQMEKEYNPTS